MSDRTFARRARQAGALTSQMERELDNASRRVRISRLQAAKDTLRREMQLFYSSYDKDLADHLKKQYSDTYRATLTGLKDTAFITMPHIDMTVSRLDAAIRKPWAVDGLTFSQRLWKDQATLVNTLHQTLSRQVALSLPPDETVKALVTAFPEKTMRSAIGRLVMTESNAIATAGTQEAYKDTGVKQYEIVATLDSKTSTICQEMDGKRFPTSKMEIGATAPPFHPWCRTTTAPYDPDFDDLLPDGPRAARDADGKTYLTNARTYTEWAAEGQTGAVEAEKRAHKKDRRDHPEIKVNKAVINSAAFAKKINSISDNKKLNDNLLKAAKEILKHRDGTLLEDLYLLDFETGKIVYKNKLSTDAQRVAYTQKMRQLLNNHPDTFVAIHNHPQGMPPRAADINAAAKNKYKRGLVVGHNGRVFVYEVHEGFEPIRSKIYDISIGKYKKLGYNELEAQYEALKSLSKPHHFSIEEVL
ncbi:minor capsid protein [Peptococcus simiae]|uniref:minor capsid protein n=1 Tax=Peptococcus simiae TaxID=1643805 RepID=UPI00397F7D91